jgi:hypothetical protein
LRRGHEGLVRDVAVGKDHLVNVIRRDQGFQVSLRVNRDTFWVTWAGEACGVAALSNVGDLRRRKGDDVGL